MFTHFPHQMKMPGAVTNRTYRAWGNIELPKYFIKLQRGDMSIENGAFKLSHSSGVLCLSDPDFPNRSFARRRTVDPDRLDRDVA